MRFTRAALLAAGALILACTEHVPTSPRGDVPQVPTLSMERATRRAMSPNEPVGYKVIADRSFGTPPRRADDGTGAEGWAPSEFQSTDITVATDPSAPHSAPFVLAMSF